MYSKLIINSKPHLCIKVTLIQALQILRSGQCPASSLTHIEQLNASNAPLNKPISVLINSLPKDLVLDLRNQGLTTEDMTKLRNALEDKAKLHQENLILLLGFNALGDEAIKALFRTENDEAPLGDDLFWQSSWHFDFTGNAITSVGMDYLASKIEYFSGALELNLHGNPTHGPLPILANQIRRRNFPDIFSLHLAFHTTGAGDNPRQLTGNLEQFVSALEKLARELTPQAAPTHFNIEYEQRWFFSDYMEYSPDVINDRISKALTSIQLKRNQSEVINAMRAMITLEAFSNPQNTMLLMSDIPIRLILGYLIELNGQFNESITEKSISNHKKIQGIRFGFFPEKALTPQNQIPSFQVVIDNLKAKIPDIIEAKKGKSQLVIDLGCYTVAKNFADQLGLVGIHVTSDKSNIIIDNQHIELLIALYQNMDASSNKGTDDPPKSTRTFCTML